MPELQKRGGWAAIAGGLLAIAGDAFVLASSPWVARDRVRYPFDDRRVPGRPGVLCADASAGGGGHRGPRPVGSVRPSRAASVFGRFAVVGIVLTVRASWR